MRKLGLIAVVFASLLTVEVASARNVWRECGIGGMLFRETGWAAITSNITWDLGTTATTSNVSSEDTCEGKAVSSARLINESYAQLEEETAVGAGPHLNTVVGIFGCDSQGQAEIVQALRADLQKRVSNPGYATESKLQKAESYHNVLMKEVSSRQSRKCQVI